MINRAGIIAIEVIMAAVLVFFASAEENFRLYTNDRFEYRDEVAPFDDIQKLLDKPRLIESRIVSDIPYGTKRLNSMMDFHAVFDIPIYSLLKLVMDLDNEQNVYPRIVYSSDLNPADPDWSPHFQEVKFSFKFGLIREESNIIFCKVPELKEDGSFLIKWNMYRSIDGKFDFSYGSWYLKEIFSDKRKYTYVRNFTHYGILDYPTHVEIAIRLLGENEGKAFFKALREAAE